MPSFKLSLAILFALAGLAQAQTAPAKFAKTKATCPDAQELETNFVITMTAGGNSTSVRFTYGSCREAERNDYLPPYTERNYDSDSGYHLTIVTNQGESTSEVLLAEGKAWIGRTRLWNGALASNMPSYAGELTSKGVKSAWSIRSVKPTIAERFPQIKTCEEVVAKQGQYFGYYGGPTILMITDKTAFYQHQDCDICDEISACDLQTGALRTAVTAHMLSCSDLEPFRKGAKIVFDCN